MNRTMKAVVYRGKDHIALEDRRTHAATAGRRHRARNAFNHLFQ